MPSKGAVTVLNHVETRLDVCVVHLIYTSEELHRVEIFDSLTRAQYNILGIEHSVPVTFSTP